MFICIALWVLSYSSAYDGAVRVDFTNLYPICHVNIRQVIDFLNLYVSKVDFTLFPRVHLKTKKPFQELIINPVSSG